MQGSDAEKKVMDNKMPVYWIVFSGLLCLESIGLIVGMIPLYWLVKGLALFWMWEMDGTKTVFNLLSKAAVSLALPRSPSCFPGPASARPELTRPLSCLPVRVAGQEGGVGGR